MSKFLCACGHIIRDQTDYLPYKADFIPDQGFFDLFDRISASLQEYVTAVQEGKVTEWLSNKGFGDGYIDLGLDHGNTLHDYILREFIDERKIGYECAQCGRLHIEGQDQQLVSYLPENGAYNGVLRKNG